MIGLAWNIPRLVLYAVLGGVMGDVGVALGFSAGSIFALIPIAFFSRRTGFSFNIRMLLQISLIPFAIAAPSILLRLHWMVGVPMILGISYIIYARLRIIGKKDLKELAEAFLPEKTIKRVYRHVRPVLWLLYGE